MIRGAQRRAILPFYRQRPSPPPLNIWQWSTRAKRINTRRRPCPSGREIFTKSRRRMFLQSKFVSRFAAQLCANGFDSAAVLKLCGYPRITSVAQSPQYTGSLIWGLYTIDGRRIETVNLQNKSYADPSGVHRALVLVLTAHVWSSAIAESKTKITVCSIGSRPTSIIAEDVAKIVKSGDDAYYFCPICGGGYRLPSPVLDALIPKIRCGRISSV